MMMRDATRREFLAAAAATTVGGTVPGAAPKPTAPTPSTSKSEGPKKGPQVCVFSKHLQFLDYDALAKTCKELGLDGVDLPVRKGGHVEPAKLATDLPRAVDAIRSQGLEAAMITTDLKAGADPDARPILEAAAKAGIRYARIGGQIYDKTGNPLEQLPRFTEELSSLAKLAEEYGVALGYHNHSGYNNVGAALWDLERIFESVRSEYLGSNFDAGHAVAEGAFGVWQINARLMAPHIKMMAVKDFVWDKDKPRWVPLGEGIVQLPEILKIVRTADFAGPISMHFEYKTASNSALIDDIGRAATTLRNTLKGAGFGALA